MFSKTVVWVALAALLTGCASTAPVRIGADTYYSSRTNARPDHGVTTLEVH